MPKKIIILIALAILISYPATAYASTGLIKPDSPVYFLQNWGESIRYFFTFGNDNKINYLIELSDRRIDEIKSINDQALIDKLIAKYEDNYSTMEKLADQVDDKVAVSQKIQDLSTRQQEVLAEVYQKVPEAAKAGVANAQENSAKHVASTIEKIEGTAKADKYNQKVQAIQRAGRAAKMQVAPMESGSPAEDPSQTTHKSLNGAKSLNRLNDTNNTNGNGSGQAQPVAPAAPQPLR